jgi:hypothetical protein
MPDFCLFLLIVYPFLHLYFGILLAFGTLAGISLGRRCYPDAFNRLIERKYGKDFDEKKVIRAMCKAILLIFLLWPMWVLGWKRDWFEWF